MGLGFLLLMQVPGFTHPVTDMYLEDILKLIGYQDAKLGGSAKAVHLNGHSKPQHAGSKPQEGPVSSPRLPQYEAWQDSRQYFCKEA